MTYLSIFEYKTNIELQKEEHNKVININKCKKIAELFWKCSLEKKKTNNHCKDEFNMIIKCIEKIHN